MRISDWSSDVCSSDLGEIFNFVELRAELEARGHVFYTRSDTEVIVHLYDRYGDRFVEHLNGQFAIALWDGASRRLVLARDRVGIRPLYWTKADGTLWFASEPKALFAAVPGRAQLSVRGLLQAFSYWAPLDPDTAWEGVHSLPPGHVLAIEADGRETLRSEAHTSELQSLMRISYSVFCLKKKITRPPQK